MEALDALTGRILIGIRQQYEAGADQPISNAAVYKGFDRHILRSYCALINLFIHGLSMPMARILRVFSFSSL